MFKKLKSINYMHYICICIVLFFMSCIFIFYQNSIYRFFESCKDFGLSIAYYFCELFEIPHNIIPTVSQLPQLPQLPPSQSPSVPLPDSFDVFKIKFMMYFSSLISLDNLQFYSIEIGNFMFIITNVTCNSGISLRKIIDDMFYSFSKVVRYFKQDGKIKNVDFALYGYQGAVRCLECTKSIHFILIYFECPKIIKKTSTKICTSK